MHLEGRPQPFTDVDEGVRAIWNTELNGVGEPQPALSNAKCDLTRDNSAPGGLEVATGPYCGLSSELAPAALLDQVAFRRLDLHPTRLQELDAPIQLLGLAGDLQQDPALVAGHVRPPDVGDDLEVPPELVDHGLFDQRGAEDQLEPPSRHFHAQFIG